MKTKDLIESAISRNKKQRELLKNILERLDALHEEIEALEAMLDNKKCIIEDLDEKVQDQRDHATWAYKERDEYRKQLRELQEEVSTQQIKIAKYRE